MLFCVVILHAILLMVIQHCVIMISAVLLIVILLNAMLLIVILSCDIVLSVILQNVIQGRVSAETHANRCPSAEYHSGESHTA